MKIVITPETKVENSSFPRLMIAEFDKCIVMVTKEDTMHFHGFCIDAGTSFNDVGTWSTCWAKNAFKEFKGKITLFN